jgi:glycosyltransferase involved in cell wall biosynthesis
MRVLHVSQPTTGGVGTFVESLALSQATAGWDVGLACPSRGNLAAATRSSRIRHLEWKATRTPGAATLPETRRLLRALETFQPDLVHLHSSKAGLAGRIALRGGLPTVFQPHGWSFYAVGGATRAAALQWERLAARWTHALVCVSQYEQRVGEERGIRAPWHVVPNTVDLEAFPPADEVARAAARRRLALIDAPIAVCVGRLSPEKGQDRLLRVWPLVRRQVPAAELILVGEGPTRDGLEGSLPPGARIVGEQRDVGTWLAAANVVVLPSRWEGMPLALLEAMASARSVVGTDVGGVREALGADAGAVCADVDASFAAAIAKRLLHPQLADAEGVTARVRATRFDARFKVEMFAEAYALARRRSRSVAAEARG